MNFNKNPLVIALRDWDFPMGGINNTLWYSFKLLLRDSKINLNSTWFKEFYQHISNKHKRSFSLNIPDTKYSFNTTFYKLKIVGSNTMRIKRLRDIKI